MNKKQPTNDSNDEEDRGNISACQERAVGDQESDHLRLTGIAGCCAHTANGHAAAAPPTNMINSRLLIASPEAEFKAPHRGLKLSQSKRPGVTLGTNRCRRSINVRVHHFARTPILAPARIVFAFVTGQIDSPVLVFFQVCFGSQGDIVTAVGYVGFAPGSRH